jgi:hypothetical protein
MAINYLKKIMACSRLTDKMIIKLKDDYPALFIYNVPDKLSMSFILAPRVEND